jgi:transcriptional regulator with XRE-family HTH domain
MYTFPELIKQIRNEAGITQAEFAKAVEVSPVLIAMVETGKKEVSKKLLLKIAEQLDVHPSSITPFLYDGSASDSNLSSIEKQFLALGTKLQDYLIKKKSKNLKKYAK